MHLSSRTILITGGSSGIGLELAIQLHLKGNVVIITGRSRQKLENAKMRQAGLITFEGDISKLEDISKLHSFMEKNHPSLSVLINNAGIMRQINLIEAGESVNDICKEIDVNLVGLIQMTVMFLPLLRLQKEAAIVNVSSGLAFVPYPTCPVYGATKAGVNSFTRSLRVQLQKASSTIKVFEIAPPPVKTPLFDDFKEEADEMSLMKVDKLVNIAIKGIENDNFLILPGMAKVLRFLSRLAPEFILKMLSKPVDKMVAKEKIHFH